jgi:hypothetical protein
MVHDTLENHYRLNHTLTSEHNISVTEIEDMMPFEREIFVALIIETQEKKKQNAIT